MKLLIDAGNTRIKWALEKNKAWLSGGALPVAQAGELSQHLAAHCDSIGLRLQDIEQVWVSNVAGEEAARHIRNIGVDRSVIPHFIVAQEVQCGVHNRYSNAGQLGSDRWAALIAAWHLERRGCLVVNCGTATTIDFLSGHGEFLGGLILPGVELMQRSVSDASAQLVQAQGKYVPLPQNTADAMYSGAIQASCGAIVRQYALLGDDSAPVVLSGGAAAVLEEHLRHVTGEASRLREEELGGHSRTGGLRPTVSWPHLKMPVHVVDNLVLQGLVLISQEPGISQESSK